jgi:hypothetical protein
MKKVKNEAELAKAALLAGMRYAEKRGAAVFERRTRSASAPCTSTGCWSTTS